jgi:hypothetical protein
MAITSSKTGARQYENDKNDCVENNSLTQRSINTERRKYCDNLYAAAGEVSKWEKSSEGQLSLYDRKKCMFRWTEDNYQRYRNTEIRVGVELLQSTELISKNVSNYIDWGTELSTNLKNISKKVKEAKSKMRDLREAACKLENCKNDSCNCSQLMVLTGEVPDNCKGESKRKPKKDRPDECEDIGELLDNLICMPKALSFDIDSILKSASEVVGIQVFSNLGTLDPLQKTLFDHSKNFKSHIQLVATTRESDLKKAREKLIECVQESTIATVELYNDRSDFEGALETVDYLCCPECDCVDTDCICDPRLKDCECKICDICDEVKTTFCYEESEPKEAAE